MRKLFLAILFLFIVNISFAQNMDSIIRYKKNHVNLELFGNVGIVEPAYLGLYSFNYERTLWNNKYGFLTIRIGFLKSKYLHRYPYLFPWDTYTFPVFLNHVFLKYNHHFEIGGGMKVEGIYSTDKNKFWWDKDFFAAGANFMYRYQKPRGRFVFRIGYTPMIYYNRQAYIRTALLINFGASAGFAF